MLPAVAALQVLCFYGLNRSLLSTTENLYLATGKPQVRTELNLLQLVLMALLMYPLTMRYGIMGAAIAAMLPSALVVGIYAWYCIYVGYIQKFHYFSRSSYHFLNSDTTYRNCSIVLSGI